ncbi:hypothetical protein D6C89_02537 [Aureobasidium pullulans]|nr:hypothetical protein D6C89_02537 [Aureobasidium pullulans]
MLQTLPLDLNHTYDRILQNIPRSRVPNAIKLLQFLAFSNRPMTLRELVDAIATDPNSSILFDVEDRLAPPDAIIGYCSSLVRLTGQTVDYKQVGSASASALPYASSIEPAPASEARSELHLKAGSDAESETEYGYEPQLELAHFSVKEYLLLHRNETPYQEYFQIPAANATIASTCLAYLWTLQKPHLTKLMDATHGMEKHEIRTKFPLTDFATRHWLDHARLAGENQEKLFFWTSKMFVDKPFMEFWLQFYNPALGMGQRLSYAKATAPALYYASLGGLDRSIRLLLDRALHAAVLGDDLTIVKLLLERGAHNTEWGLHGAVEAAVMNDRYDMLETLLLHFSERDRENDVLNAALGYTGLDTDGRIIRILLEMGADNIHRKNKLLAEACHRGYVAKVKLLLDFGAKFDRHFNCLTGTKNRRFNPLRHFYVASQGAQFEIAKLLVARDAKSNSSDLYNATALKYACAIGRHEIVEYLLESGADVPKPCDYLSLPLDIACRNGALEVIEMLLAYGAKANACDSGALTAACKGGHIEVAQLLLAQGADVVGRRNRETPIQAACSEGHLELVKLLLANGADHNAAGGSSGSALSNACLSGNTALVNLLLDRGVDPNAMDSLYGSALQRLCATASYINLEIVQLLLDRGADVDTRGGKFRAALCDAALYDNVEVVRMLLQRGADPSLRDKRFGGALQAACYFRHGNFNLVQLLLDNGTDVNVRGGRYGNALCAAVYNGHVESAHMLLDRGAHIDMRGGKYGNALQIAIKKHLDDIRKRLLMRGWRIVIQKRPFWMRRCALSNWHPSIQRKESLHPLDGDFSRSNSSGGYLSSNESCFSASSGTTRT